MLVITYIKENISSKTFVISLFYFLEDAAMEWTDQSPVVFSLWNVNVKHILVPNSIHSQQTISTNPCKSCDIYVYPQLIYFWKLALDRLQPDCHIGNNCSIMLLMGKKMPAWIQIPCNMRMLYYFICQYQSYNTPSYDLDVTLCPKQWYTIGEECFYIKLLTIYGGLYHNISLIPHSCRHINETNMFEQHNNVSVLLYLYQLAYNMGTDVMLICNEAVKVLNQCLPGQFKCEDNTCISDLHVCDGQVNCPLGRDELHCQCKKNGILNNNSTYCRYECIVDECKCHSLYQQLTSGGCVPYWDDIPKNQMFDTIQHICPDGYAIPMSKVNDFIPDCVNFTDEIEFYKLLGVGVTQTGICGTGQLPCYKGHSRCFSSHDYCVYDLDNTGRLKTCTNAAHLQSCVSFPCSNAYKCPGSYCIPHRRVCDGIKDCADGSDEESCLQYSCVGMLKCKDTSFCIHPIEMCDGVSQCPYGEDEVLCDIQSCPEACHCLALAVQCIDSNLTYLPNITQKLFFLMLKGNHIVQLNLGGFKSLTVLQLPDNSLREICSSIDGLFNIHYLDVSRNNIDSLTYACFSNMLSLHSLFIQENKIRALPAYVFQGLKQLYLLNISHNRLTTFPRNIFNGLINIEVIDLVNNHIKVLHYDLIYPLINLHALFTDDFRICCMVKTGQCKGPLVTLSSCSSLIKYTWLYIWMWLISLIGLILNLIVLILSGSRSSNVNIETILVKNMSISDILGVLYIFIICTNEEIYKGIYALYDWQWRSSILCHFASVLSSVSIIMSCISTVMITGVRYRVIINQCTSSNKTIIVVIVMWGVAISLSIIALYSYPMGDAFGLHVVVSSRLCLLLSYNSVNPLSEILPITLVFLLISSLCFIWTLYFKIGLYVHATQAEVSRFDQKFNSSNKNIIRLILNIFILVFSNFISLITTLLSNILDIVDKESFSEVTMFLIIISLSVNIINNPILYTIKTRQFRLILKNVMKKHSKN